MTSPNLYCKDLKQFCIWSPKSRVMPTFMYTKCILKAQKVYECLHSVHINKSGHTSEAPDKKIILDLYYERRGME